MNLSLPEEIQNFGQKGMENDLKKLEALIFIRKLFAFSRMTIPPKMVL